MRRIGFVSQPGVQVSFSELIKLGNLVQDGDRLQLANGAILPCNEGTITANTEQVIEIRPEIHFEFEIHGFSFVKE